MKTLTIGITTQDINLEHILENCIRTHFSGSYHRWLSQITCFSCHRTSHISKHCPTRSKAANFECDKGKAEVEHIINDMNKTWKKKDAEGTSNGEGITSPNGSSGHTSSN